MCESTGNVNIYMQLAAHEVHAVNVRCCLRAPYLFISVPSRAPVNTNIHSNKDLSSSSVAWVLRAGLLA